jgi:hypothetical protein
VNPKCKVRSIPIGKTISWEDWLAGRKARRQTSRLIEPRPIRRQKSSSDTRLKKLYSGKRGPSFTPTTGL